MHANHQKHNSDEQKLVVVPAATLARLARWCADHVNLAQANETLAPEPASKFDLELYDVSIELQLMANQNNYEPAASDKLDIATFDLRL